MKTATQSTVSYPTTKSKAVICEDDLYECEWRDFVFIHFAVDPLALQRVVPYPLELWAGRAYVSLVAFTMRNIRLSHGGRFSEWLFKPIADHPLFNVRTYVRHKGQSGIYFMTEYLESRISRIAGALLYGLPFRLASLDYLHDVDLGHLRGAVTARNSRALKYDARIKTQDAVGANERERDAFLLDREYAFTLRRGTPLRFRVLHAPWHTRPLEVSLVETSLIDRAPWFGYSCCVGGHWSPGFPSVQMGRHHRC